MNANKAKRRWLRWCRYVAATQSESGLHGKWKTGGIHAGQAKAYQDYAFAQRAYPRGARLVWYPAWGSVRRD